MTTPADLPTVIRAKDRKDKEIECIIEHAIPVDGATYVLLTPVDVPVVLVRIGEGSEDKDRIIEDIEGAEHILSVADKALAEYRLVLVRSAVDLTVSGELGGPSADEMEEEMEEAGEMEEMEEVDEDGDLYERLIHFRADGREYGLYIPLDPFFVVARMEGTEALVVEGEEMSRIRARLDEELDKIGQG